MKNAFSERGVSPTGAPPEPLRSCTVFEVTYFDNRKKASGEPLEDCYVTVLFEFKEEAHDWASQHNGRVDERIVTKTERNRLRRVRSIV